MNLRTTIAALAVVACGFVLADRAEAQYPGPWHGNYYHQMYNAPVALVVPPNADLQTNWGWGVTNTRITPLYHQFGRTFPGYAPGGFGYGFYPTPAWPSDTNQFGVYYVRGPW